jgi:hypothetical protein
MAPSLEIAAGSGTGLADDSARGPGPFVRGLARLASVAVGVLSLVAGGFLGSYGVVQLDATAHLFPTPAWFSQ